MSKSTFVLQAVLVVNSALKMSSGKIAAQCAHAAVGLYKNMYINGVPWLASWEVSPTYCIAAQRLAYQAADGTVIPKQCTPQK